MEIAYISLPHTRIDEIAGGGKTAFRFLRDNYMDVSDYDHVVVYKEENGVFTYYKAFSVVEEKGVPSIVERGKIKRPTDSIHKFWARKPWWAVAQYILTYSKEGDTICDPMCGSAIAGYEALRLRRRAIMLDWNPFAVFLARNTIRPLDKGKLISAYNEVLQRPMEDKMDLFKGSKTVKDAICNLYETQCRKCKGEASARAFVWDTIYEYTGAKLTSQRNKILLEAMSRELETSGIPSVVSQHWILTKWRSVLTKCRELSETKYPKSKTYFEGPMRPGLVTRAFGLLVRKGVYARKERKPILVYYFCNDKQCSNHRGVIEKLSEKDWNLIEKVEAAKQLCTYPTTEFKYSDGELFDTARPDSLFVPNERLATWNDSEIESQSEKAHHLFTKRNLLALSVLFWSITQVRADVELKEALLLAFTETLYKVSKLNSYEIRSVGEKFRIRRATMWRENRFSIPPDFSEENVYHRYDRSVAKIYDAMAECSFEIRDYYNEAENADEFVTNKDKTILFLRNDAREIKKIFAKYKDIVDMVFTDPPYGDAIQYFELCTFWTAWLLLDADWKERYGDGDWWKKEIIKNDVQGKSLDDFAEDLTEAFRSLNEIVVPDASWVITYHKREPKYWTALSDSLLLCGLGFYHEDKHKLLGRSFNPSSDFRFLETDAYTVWKRLIVEKIRSMGKAAEEFFRIISPLVATRHGIIPRTIIEKAYVEMAWSTEKDVYEKFFANKFDTFLKKHAILIPRKDGVLSILRRDSPPSGIPHAKWMELWDKSYGRLSVETLLTEVLKAYIKSKVERSEIVSLDDMYTDVVRRIDGRVTQDMVLRTIEEIAQYDWLKGTYILKQVPITTGVLTKWIESKKEIELPKPPEKLIPSIAFKLVEKEYSVYIGEEYEPPQLSSVYSRKIVKRVRADFKKFPLVLEKNGMTICIDINTFARASQVLLKEGAKVIVLLGSDAIKERAHYFKSYVDREVLLLLDVRNRSTDEVVDKVVSLIEEK